MADDFELRIRVVREVDLVVRFPDTESNNHGSAQIGTGETMKFVYFDRAISEDTKVVIGWRFHDRIYATNDGLVEAIRQYVSLFTYYRPLG